METPLILRTLKGELTEQVPIWFMRQAGRYLPEYQQIRKNFPQFLEFCYTPEAACEVTLQPIRRFDFDAAILFSDILVIPDALGQHVKFVKGEGPKLLPISNEADMQKLTLNRVETHLQPVCETIRLVRKELSPQKALIGFSGSPWTLACYMLEGQGSREFQIARAYAEAQPQAFMQLLRLLVEAISLYCRMQIEAGAQIIQLFDSWAGVVPASRFSDYVSEPTRQIVANIRHYHPDIPIIGFAKAAGANLTNYAAHSGVDGLGIDQSMPIAWAKQYTQGKILQGNLDNVSLMADREAALQQSDAILNEWQTKPFIFNLGHGILQTTPIAHVQAVVEKVKGFRRHV